MAAPRQLPPPILRERSRDQEYPVGIPIAPPPDWVSVPQPTSLETAMWLLAKPVILGASILLCMGLGWISVGKPSKPRPAPEQVAKANTDVERPAEKYIEKNPELKGKKPAPTPEPKKSSPPVVKNKAEPPETKKENPKTPVVKKKEDPPPPATPPKPTGPVLTYEKHILPIMERACLNCHQATKKRGGLDLSTFAAMKQGGENGQVVKPGKIEDSPLWTTIAAGEMPPSGTKLPDADLKMIREWILSGAHGAPKN